MDWTDEAIVLSARAHGEGSAVVSLLTRQFGRHAGLLRGLTRQRASVEPGTVVQATWRARLPEQLGQYTLEARKAIAPGLFDDATKLAALVSACALADAALPEREPHAHVFDGLAVLLDILAQPRDIWAPAYVQWEIGLLSALGFGLHLERCAVTGENDALTYVSPRTGSAVSASAGEPYAERLLRLPPFLIGLGLQAPSDIVDGLKLTGHFLERVVFHALHKEMPPTRARLIERISADVQAN
jgi:DNA repair protein RecO (recombination protein O)